MAETNLVFSDIVRLIRDQRRQKNTISKDDFETLESDHRRCWATLVYQFYIENVANASDDLLFFVKCEESEEEDRLIVLRKSSSQIPKPDDLAINWEETLYLNLVVQQFDYYLTCAVAEKREGEPLKILKKSTERVYASPSSRRMDKKGKETSLTYPYVFFTVDNFEETFRDMIFKEEHERLVVELVAVNPEDSKKIVIFQGALGYDAFKEVYLAKASTATKMAQKMSFGLWHGSDQAKFLSMRGPGGKGHAEVAVTRVTDDVTQTEVPNQNGGTKKTKRDRGGGWGSLFRWKSGSSSSASSSTGSGSATTTASYHKESESEAEKGDGDSEMVEFSSSGESDVSTWKTKRFLKPLGSAVDWWKSRKVGALHISTCLTYIKLPWERIILDVLNSKQNPVLKTDSK